MEMIVICKKLAVGMAMLAVGVAGCADEPSDGGGGQGNDDRPQEARGGAGATPSVDDLGWPEEEVAHAQPVLRAVVSEHGSGDVHVIDLASGDTVRTVQLEGHAQVEPAGDPTHVLLPQSAQDVTHVLDAGIRWKDHGGHLDPAHVRPEVAGSAETKNPVHVTSYDGRVTTFADDEGAAYVWQSGDDGLEPDPVRTLRTGRAHHGFGLALPGGRLLTGVPPKDQRAGALPDGVRLYDENDQPVRDFASCPDLHGEYGHDGTFVFGCANGAMVLRQHDGQWEMDTVDNPSTGKQRSDGQPRQRSRPAESGAQKGSSRLGAFYGGSDDRVVGTYGDDAMAVVDLENDRMKLIELDHPRADAIWDPYWEQVVLLTTDGKLHAIDPETGKLSNSTRVLDEFELSSDRTRARPSISTGENAIYVTDPQRQRLVEVAISSDGFEPRRAKDLDFVPFSIGVLGMAL